MGFFLKKKKAPSKLYCLHVYRKAEFSGLLLLFNGIFFVLHLFMQLYLLNHQRSCGQDLNERLLQQEERWRKHTFTHQQNKTSHRLPILYHFLICHRKSLLISAGMNGRVHCGRMCEKDLEASSGGESMQMFNLLTTGELYQRWSSYIRHRTSEFIAGTLSDRR